MAFQARAALRRAGLSVGAAALVVSAALGASVAGAQTPPPTNPPGWAGTDIDFEPTTATPCQGAGGQRGTVIKWVPLRLDGDVHIDKGSQENTWFIQYRWLAAGRQLDVLAIRNGDDFATAGPGVYLGLWLSNTNGRKTTYWTGPLPASGAQTYRFQYDNLQGGPLGPPNAWDDLRETPQKVFVCALARDQYPPNTPPTQPVTTAAPTTAAPTTAQATTAPTTVTTAPPTVPAVVTVAPATVLAATVTVAPTTTPPTTAAPTTVTTSTTTTTTTVPPTIPVAPPASVAGVLTTRPPSFTGSNLTLPLTLGGVAIIGVGVAFIVVGRRRESDAVARRSAS